MRKALLERGTEKQRNLRISWRFNPKSRLWKVDYVTLCVFFLFFILNPVLRSLCGTAKS